MAKGKHIPYNQLWGKFWEEINSFSHLGNFRQYVRMPHKYRGHLQSTLGDISYHRPMRHSKCLDKNEFYSPA